MSFGTRLKNVFFPSEQRTISADAWENIGTPSSSGVTINKNNAMTLSGVYSAVRVYADALASLPIHVIKETGRTKEKDKQHPVYKLLAYKPNNIMTSFDWRQIAIPQLLLWGNSYNLIEFAGGGSRRPISILPIHPSMVTVNLLDGQLAYTIKAEGMQDVTVDQSQMIHFRGLGDNIEGKSVLDYAADNLGLGKAAEDFGSSFFKNGASTSGVLSTEQQLSDKAINNLRDSFNNTYTGVNQSNKMMILEQGLKYMQTSVPPDSAQFLESRQFSISDIARWFKLPPHTIGDLENATFSNIEQQDLNFVKYSILPYVENMEQELNCKLFRENEQGTVYVNMNLEGLLRGDITTRVEAYQKLIQNGVMTPNEARSKEGMNPIDGLDNTWMNVAAAPIIDGTNQQKTEEAPKEDKKENNGTEDNK